MFARKAAGLITIADTGILNAKDLMTTLQLSTTMPQKQVPVPIVVSTLHTIDHNNLPVYEC